MVKAVVELGEEANRVINILKAQYGLKDKSEAINEMARQYNEMVLEAEVKPQYIEKLVKIQEEPTITVGDTDDFRERYGGGGREVEDDDVRDRDQNPPG